MHFNNAVLHRSAATGKCLQSCQFRHAPQPPESRDISPCDFFLFGDLKMKLKGEELESTEELQNRVKELFGHGPSEAMQ
jgi:hypothetical protein